MLKGFVNSRINGEVLFNVVYYNIGLFLSFLQNQIAQRIVCLQIYGSQLVR